ncbi:Conserved hypothetical protein [Seminavis robusta]|uniref:Glycerophosphocholine acyltransferase 1 n=1 Tax=Seminavis robusta TaxID=568900 RepID=A0A9N8F1D2_9STRA|nr:Conserved hypothetical protein [Seminavis robusta]|eukprot:Sro3088_g343460.1 Conserved hypothetical protein (431) ;mRNA; r:4724-6016
MTDPAVMMNGATHERTNGAEEFNGNNDDDGDTQLRLSMSNIQADTIRKVLTAVQRHERERIQEGFNEWNFAAGVLNTMLVAYIFGNFPEHFWLLWLLEAAALIPRKIWQDWHALPLRQILYYVDYCWVMTFVIIFSLYFLCVNWTPQFMPIEIPYEWRKNMYLAVLGVGCGPLLGATAAMPFVAMVFHDNKMMTSLFIHATPPMLVYSFQWHAEEIVQAWPSFFRLEDVGPAEVTFFPPDKGPFFWPGQGLGTVAGNATALYCIWFIPYCTWMSCMGLDLTRKVRRKKGSDGLPLPTSKYDTAFHSIFRDGIHEGMGYYFGRSPEESRRQQTEGDYRTRDFLVIMIMHAICVWLATMMVAYVCLLSKKIHAALLWLIIVLTVFRGAQQYVYWVTSMSSKAVQEEFAEILKDVEGINIDNHDNNNNTKKNQ